MVLKTTLALLPDVEGLRKLRQEFLHLHRKAEPAIK
jgi:hypothetical protein